MSFANSLTRLARIRYPIIQAPMVGVSTPALAAAVSNAGALGSIGIGASSVEQAREMIAATRSLTENPFNVNVFCHREAVHDSAREAQWIRYLKPFFEEFQAPAPSRLTAAYPSFNDNRPALEMLLEEKPAVVSFHFGLPPAEWIQALQAVGIVTFGCATTPEEACIVEAAGVDAVVAQGAEAGGHRGVFAPEKGDRQIGSLALTRLVSAASGIPVIAAGGIMDGQGIEAAFDLGAAGAQLGTAFILSPESAAGTAHRQALKSERSHHTQITSVISGRPARSLVNRMHTDVDRPGAPALPDYLIAYSAGKALAAAATAGNSAEFSAHWAGQGVPLAREMPAGELIESLVQDCQFLSLAR